MWNEIIAARIVRAALRSQMFWDSIQPIVGKSPPTFRKDFVAFR